MKEFNQLIDECGLSKQGAARLLHVRYDTIKNWYYGRSNAPERVIKLMTEYNETAVRLFGEGVGDKYSNNY